MEKAIAILYCCECGKQHGSAVMRSTVRRSDEIIIALEDVARTLDDGCCGSVHDFRILLSGAGKAYPYRYTPVRRVVALPEPKGSAS